MTSDAIRERAQGLCRLNANHDGLCFRCMEIGVALGQAYAAGAAEARKETLNDVMTSDYWPELGQSINESVAKAASDARRPLVEALRKMKKQIEGLHHSSDEFYKPYGRCSPDCMSLDYQDFVDEALLAAGEGEKAFTL